MLRKIIFVLPIVATTVFAEPIFVISEPSATGRDALVANKTGPEDADVNISDLLKEGGASSISDRLFESSPNFVGASYPGYSVTWGEQRLEDVVGYSLYRTEAVIAIQQYRKGFNVYVGQKDTETGKYRASSNSLLKDVSGYLYARVDEALIGQGVPTEQIVQHVCGAGVTFKEEFGDWSSWQNDNPVAYIDADCSVFYGPTGEQDASFTLKIGVTHDKGVLGVASIEFKQEGVGADPSPLSDVRKAIKALHKVAKVANKKIQLKAEKFIAQLKKSGLGEAVLDEADNNAYADIKQRSLKIDVKKINAEHAGVIR